MRVLITGSRGFIGSNLRLWLEWSGHDVVGIDLMPHSEVQGSVSAYLPGMLDDYRPDVVIHLAASVTRDLCERQPLLAIRNNTELTAFVARECARRRIKLAYASTSEVYGDHGEEIVDEQTLPRPTSGIYGLTKLHGEHFVAHYCERALVMRLCMAYGPSQQVGPGKAALPTFIDNAIRGETITVHRDASRCWCFVDDVARAIRDLIEQDHFGVFNVGRDDEYVRMDRVARIACGLAGASKDLIRYIDPPPLQTVIKRITCAKLARETGWRPQVNLDDGMVRCYEALAAEHRQTA